MADSPLGKYIKERMAGREARLRELRVRALSRDEQIEKRRLQQEQVADQSKLDSIERYIDLRDRQG